MSRQKRHVTLEWLLYRFISRPYDISVRLNNYSHAPVDTTKHSFDVLFRLFLVVPEAKSLFTRLNVNEEASPGFQAHVVRVINGLDICINSLSRPKLLESVTDHMATQHFVRVGVTHEHFDVSMTIAIISSHGQTFSIESITGQKVAHFLHYSCVLR